VYKLGFFAEEGLWLAGLVFLQQVLGAFGQISFLDPRVIFTSPSFPMNQVFYLRIAASCSPVAEYPFDLIYFIRSFA
jgi:hypothetical protein